MALKSNTAPDVYELMGEMNIYSSALDEADDVMDVLFDIVEKVKKWGDNTRQAYFSQHTSTQPDREFFEIYGSYFRKDGKDIDDFLVGEDFISVKEELGLFFSELSNFFSKIEKNPQYNYPINNYCYRYRYWCEYERPLYLM